MVKADLITGFLGAGKTTFIRKYALRLASLGHRVCILENDYGAINVDMMLLSDLKSDRSGLEMVAGGCDYDCHRRRFKTKLITMAMLGYDRVIIEPSGIFDVDEFFDLMHEDPLDSRYEIGNVITIVKAEGERETSPETDYLLASQAAQAGTVVLSHVQEADPAALPETIAHLNRALEGIGCRRRFSLEENVLSKDWEHLTPEDFEAIERRGYTEAAFEKRFSMDDNGFTSLFYMDADLEEEQLKDRVRKLFADASAGRVRRVKGFFLREDGSWAELNATPEGMRIHPLEEGQRVIIVIGEQLRTEVIDPYFPSKYSTSHWR
jgi:G3E family GTPase